MTLFAWWWSSRPTRDEPREPAPVPIHKQQSRLLKDARKAARTGDGTGVKQALLEWAALEWPDNAPRSIGAIAERVSDPLASELRSLSRSSYGAAPGDWNGTQLARALRAFAVLSDDDSVQRDRLPPLMPGTR